MIRLVFTFSAGCAVTGIVTCSL